MKNTFGQNVALTVFGESHGAGVGVVLDGLCAGIDVNEDEIKTALALRAPSMSTDTARREKDEFKILSGVFNGKSTGTPICIFVPNENTDSKAYEYGVARPSHADFTAFCKFGGYEDYRGGGHFSGRVTAGIVAVGAILKGALKGIGVSIGTHILECANVRDNEFYDIQNEVLSLEYAKFPVLNAEKEEEMIARIEEAKANLDSVGGITQTAIVGMPCGVGEPMFDSVEGLLSHALFAIGGIKGIEFGKGFAMSKMKGSQANDAFVIKDGKVATVTNNNGGINGGITNGMPVLFNCAIKPTPSIAAKQYTVDFVNGKETEIEIKGRHDPAIVRRICPVINSVSALAVCDLLAGRYGTDVFKKGIK